MALLDNINNNNKAFQWEGVQRVFALDQHQHHNKKESSSSSSSKKNKDKGAVVKAIAVAVPSNVTRLALVGRLLHIVADVESGAGCRPPTAEGWETHMQQIVLGTTSASASITTERSNVRNVSTLLLHHILRAHTDTLAGRWVELSVAPQECRARKLPDEYKLVSSHPATTAATTSFYNHVVSYYPYVLHALRCLQTCNSGGDDGPLGALAAAWIFHGPKTDATLVRYATDLLLGAVDGTVRPSPANNNSLQHLELDKPLTLVEPKAAAASSRKRKASSKKQQQPQSSELLVAGLIPDAHSPFGCDEKLALLLRGCSSSSLAHVLVDTLEACYDTRRHTDGNNVVVVADGSSSKRKTSAAATASHKRQRNSTTKASSKVVVTATTTTPVADAPDDAPYGYVCSSSWMMMMLSERYFCLTPTCRRRCPVLSWSIASLSRVDSCAR